MFVIDAVISEADERWEDTVDMLSTFIEFSLPEDPSVGVVLLGGSSTPQVPIPLSSDTSKEDVLDYIQNDMPSLGGERYTLNSLQEATEMLQPLDDSEQVIFFVTHGPTVDESQSPCVLSAIWSPEGINVVTIMDGDVEPMETITCLEDSPYEYSNTSLYFNTTVEYELNMDKIQATTGLETEVNAHFLKISHPIR